MTNENEQAPLYLRRREERRLLAGHMWVYSNEIDTIRSPLDQIEPGQTVDILSHNGRWLGQGYANPHSLICARLISRDRNHLFDRSLIIHRLQVALSLRQRLFAEPYYRLVYGESDGLPGIVIDRYDDVCVMQITTAGMERRRDDLLYAINKVIHPRSILLRCDQTVRELEGLALYSECIGDIPEFSRVIEFDRSFDVSLAAGQKTGWFYDQRDNRAHLLPLVNERSVLDLYSYVGAWGVHCAASGANQVTCVDSSQPAIDLIKHNADLNGVAEKVQTRKADVLEFLKSLRAQKQHFDVVILDPPALIKRKKDLKAGVEAYHRLNQAALQVIGKDGVLVSCSCSYHLSAVQLLDIVRQAGLHIDRSLQLLYQGTQAMDHPVHPAMPETQYLKCFIFRVLPRR